MRRIASVTMGVSLAALTWGAMSNVAMAQSAAANQAAATAQDNGTPSVTNAGTDVVVTARRSAERLQDVPLAISAVTAKQLQASHNVGLADIAKITPGLKFTAFLDGFNGNVTIRGLQQENVQNSVGNVGTFLDGIYLQRGYLVDSALGDYDRIEVVKGPQSALYGQNTFAGAVNFVVRQPTDTFHANGELTAGNGDLGEARLGVGGPIIPGILDARLYGAISEFGGVLPNNWPGATGGSRNFGGHRWTNYSGGLKFTPTDKLTFNVFYYDLSRWQQISPFYTIDGTQADTNLNCGAATMNTSSGKSLFCGDLPTNPAAFRNPSTARNTGFFYQPQPGTFSTTQVFKGSASYKINDDLTLNYIYGNVRGSSLEQADFTTDSSVLPPFRYIYGAAQREGGLLTYSSHEARLVYNGPSPLKGEVGFFHSDADDHLIFGLLFIPYGVNYASQTNNPTSLVGVGIPFDNQDTTYATNSPFGRLTYNFLDDRAQISAELRYTFTSLADNDLLARAATPGLPLLKATYGDFTPRFTAQYKFSPDEMIYASAARGAKAGGFNGYVAGSVTLLPSEQSFGEETNWTYEAGWKAQLFDHALSIDADIFYVDWDNKQEAVEPSNYVPVNSQSAGVVPQIYENVGNAYSYGFELTTLWRPTGNITLNWSLSLQNPRFTAGAKALPSTPNCDNIVCNTSGDIGGNEIAQVSKVSTDFGGEYHGMFSDGIRYFIGADESYRGPQYVDDVNVARIAGYWLTDLHAGLAKDAWSVNVWAKNVFDARYVDASFVVPSIYQYNVNLGDPRTFGVTLAVNY
jgi:iron complex outermembrane receptor protein